MYLKIDSIVSLKSRSGRPFIFWSLEPDRPLINLISPCPPDRQSDTSATSAMKLQILTFVLILNLLEAKSFSIEDLSDESGSSLSFEQVESQEKSSSPSSESIDLSEEKDSKEIDKSGVIDNDQVFCSWEDVDARDEMATKLKTELCRFSMVIQKS